MYNPFFLPSLKTKMMFLENENRSFGWSKQKELPTKISYFSKETIPFKPNQHQSSTYKLIYYQHFPPHAYRSKAIALSFSQCLSLTKENKKGASLIGDTPFIIEKSMILHFSRDPSHKFSLQNSRSLIAHLFIL